ncbi:putative bifunctional diguanylate cyclase/phosphodiesterase [Sphingomonas arenae]|uniref:putative bifunctional diguanylate cyclase/phosphodiesterase n=1 Tax=Sphingomonas arenae TaxID=2812555 RepID=UPI001966FFAC|nr:EAL domain-containing protein [Sphingomonas arenae]
MRSDPTKAGTPRPERPLKLLLLAAVLSLIFGAIGAQEGFENALRTVRNGLHPQKASGDIVLISIDEQSLREVGEWPWPRSTQAKLIDKAAELGARQIVADTIYDNPSNPKEDAALAASLKRFGRVILPARKRLGPDGSSKNLEALPHPLFRQHAVLGTASSWYNYQHAILRLPYSLSFSDREIPSFAVLMAEKPARSGVFRVDYSIDPTSVPRIPASEVLKNRIPADFMRGKVVVIGQTAEQLGDQFWIPGRGRMGGAYVAILGAETLKKGYPVDLGWLAPLMTTLLIIGFACLRSGRSRDILIIGTGLTLLAAPILLERELIFVDVVPSIFALLVVGGRIGWRRWRERGLTNTLTGLPNLEALRAQRNSSERALIAARVHNYAEIASTLNEAEEQDLVRSIADRLSVAQASQTVFQGDEGIFSWLIDGEVNLAHHLEALHALFRAPVSAGGRSIDVAISFGAEMGSERALTNRLGSALVAADEAWAEGLRWKLHDPAREEEVSWRLSLLSQLDAAIDNGEVWLAYQPQLDLRTNQIVGAEALARWTHPEKGPISPSEFVAAAEAHGRITKLTDFVLDRAISSAAAINRRGTQFGIAVNLSARLLTDWSLVDRVERMLKIHGLAPGLLTLELTETAAITEADNAIALLDRLKVLGVRLAIDDYGTGLSTLDYLKKVPADEIKIDQSFVRSMRVNRSDLIMVQSTIALAHSLGRKVIAEGVEDRQVFEELQKLDCDLVQGFVVGRPMGIRELVARLAVRQEKRVA